MQATLALGALVTASAAILFGLAGRLVARREVPPPSRAANLAFSAWWWSAASIMLLLCAGNVLGLAGVMDVDLHVALLHVKALPLSLALGSLMFYLLFLFTGRQGVLKPVAAAYAAHFAFTTWFFGQAGPWTTQVTTWDVRVVPEEPMHGPLGVLFGALLAGPFILTCVGYLLLAFRVGSREQRFRVGLIALSLGQWFLVLLVSFLLGLEDREWFSLLYQVPGLVAGVLVVVAFRPPAWLRARLGLAASA